MSEEHELLQEFASDVTERTKKMVEKGLETPQVLFLLYPDYKVEMCPILIADDVSMHDATQMLREKILAMQHELTAVVHLSEAYFYVVKDKKEAVTSPSTHKDRQEALIVQVKSRSNKFCLLTHFERGTKGVSWHESKMLDGVDDGYLESKLLDGLLDEHPN